MGPKVLYIVRRLSPNPLLPASPVDADISIILAQEAVASSAYSGVSVYALAEDAQTRNLTPSVGIISYTDFVGLVFESDRVVAV